MHAIKVSMESPISSTIVEIFLKHFEDIHIKKILDTKKKHNILHTLRRRHLNYIQHQKNTP